MNNSVIFKRTLAFDREKSEKKPIEAFARFAYWNQIKYSYSMVFLHTITQSFVSCIHMYRETSQIKPSESTVDIAMNKMNRKKGVVDDRTSPLPHSKYINIYLYIKANSEHNINDL